MDIRATMRIQEGTDVQAKAIPLSYSPRRRRIRPKYLVLAGMIATLAAIIWMFWHPLSVRVHGILCQRTCAHFELPPDYVCYNRYYAVGWQYKHADGGWSYAQKLRNLIPPESPHLRPALPWQTKDMPCTVYMHERRHAKGRRIVIVGMPKFQNSDSLSLQIEIIQPSLWRGAPKLIRETGDGFQGEPGSDRFESSVVFGVKLYAGQSDPADPARFSIRYEYEGIVSKTRCEGFIDGRLRDDDTVEFTVRGGPLRPWP